MNGERILSILSGQEHFCEARIERTENSSIRFKDGELQADSGISEAMGVRVFNRGCWGFASGEVSEFEGLLERAKKLASLKEGKLKLGKREESGANGKFGKGGKGVGAEKLCNLCGELEGEMKGKRVKNRGIALIEQTEGEEYYNSLGDEIMQETLVLYGRFSAVGREGGRAEQGGERFSSLNGWDEEKLFWCAREAARKCEDSLDAKESVKGEYRVIMDPVLAGVFAHEAVGHASEGDAVIEGTSVLGDKLGKRVGSELISIWDDPSLEGGFGKYVYDSEGVKGEKAMLLEEGIVAGRMHSLETSAETGENANGHARAESCACSPVVRMSNTCIEPGESPFDELIEGKGLYLKGMNGGSVDPFTGQFMFRCEEAFRVDGGEVAGRLRPVAITGTILETLHEIDGVGKDFATSPGFCGKDGQSVRVSDGGPHVRVGKIKVG
jgi:TldD protein